MANKDPELRRQYQADWYQRNRASQDLNAANYRLQLKLEMIAAYGGKCTQCGYVNPLALVLDHILDNAREDRRLNGHNGGYKLYMQLRSKGWPKEDYQLLCCNCNAIKEHYRRHAKQISKSSQTDGNGGPQPSDGEESRREPEGSQRLQPS